MCSLLSSAWQRLHHEHAALTVLASQRGRPGAQCLNLNWALSLLCPTLQPGGGDGEVRAGPVVHGAPRLLAVLRVAGPPGRQARPHCAHHAGVTVAQPWTAPCSRASGIMFEQQLL